MDAPFKLEEGSPPPDSSMIKSYLTWWAASSTGRLDEKVSIASAETTWARFQAIVYRLTGSPMRRKVNEDILAVSSCVFVLEQYLT
jgi:hypothetical protein